LLIINADDFGLSSVVNRAVLEAFERRLVSSATVMAVSPSFDEACSLAVDRGLQQHIGVHLVLTAGWPLTEPIRQLPRFCGPDGSFRPRRDPGPIVHLSGRERAGVVTEWCAQIEACRAGGLPVTHVDSHEHVHTELGLWPALLQTVRQMDVPYVRRGRSGDALRATARLNQALFNARLWRSGLRATRHFGDIDDYRRLRLRDREVGSDLELMTHPDLNDQGALVDFHCSQPGAELASLLADVEGAQDAVSFSGDRY
jgi:predicted glycoside hydrolase/deacetylase ChbG (UPF0249 family)